MSESYSPRTVGGRSRVPPAPNPQPSSRANPRKARAPVPAPRPSQQRSGEVSLQQHSSQNIQDEPTRGILVKNAQGTKYSHNTSTMEFIGPGELVRSVQDKYFNYQLLRDPSVFLSCKADDIKTLTVANFSLLEGIKNRGERLQAFKQKLSWGAGLREGSNVQVTIPGLVSRESRAVVCYKGRVGSDPGTVFGVQILEALQQVVRGSCDGTHQGKRYFTCPKGCGLFVTLEQLSPAAGEESAARTPTLEREAPPLPLREARKSYENLEGDLPTPPVPQRLGRKPRVIQRARSEELSPQQSPQRVFKISPRHQSSTSSESYEEVEIDLIDDDEVSSPPPLPPHHPPPSPGLEPSTILSTSHLPPILSRSPPLTPVPTPSHPVITGPEASRATNQSSNTGRECSTPENHSSELNYLRRKCERLQAEEKRFMQLDEERQAKIEELTTKLRQTELENKEYLRRLELREDEVSKKGRHIRSLQEKLDDCEDHSVQIHLPPMNSETWKVPRHLITSLSMKQIGCGSWGTVHAAKFQGRDVAIKIAHPAIFHESTVELLKREVMIMSHLQHPNLVRFVAAVWDEAVERKKATPIIVSELMDTNLRAAYAAKSLASSLISIFRDVAYALHYLHCLHIIHRDISSPNVLLKFVPGGPVCAKVSDFGSANLVRHSKTAGAGAIIYAAPEMFPREGIHGPPRPVTQTSKVDVYSFGILLLEVICTEIPALETIWELMKKARQQKPVLYELMKDCTQNMPEQRPTMAEVITRLHNMAK